MENTVISQLNLGTLTLFLNEFFTKVNELRLALSESLQGVVKLLATALAVIGAFRSFGRSLAAILKKGGSRRKRRSKPLARRLKVQTAKRSKKSSVAKKRVKKCRVDQ